MDHISCSQINMFLRCPRQWAYRYIDEIKIPPQGSLIKGSSVHGGAEVGAKHKIATQENPPAPYVVEAAVSKFEEITDGQDVDWQGDSKGAAKDAVADMSIVYAKNVIPAINPLSVEEKFEIDIEGTKVVGIVDMITTNGKIRDLKTSRKTPNQSEVEGNLQLAAYSVAYERVYGMLPGEIALDYIVHQKKGITYVPVSRPPDTRAINLFYSAVDNITRGITAGVFPPNPNGWHCSKDYCGYYGRCEKDTRRYFIKKEE